MDGLDGAAGRPEGEDGGGPRRHRVARAAHCSQSVAGEGAAEQQAALGAQQEGVGVPRGQSQRGQAHHAGAGAAAVACSLALTPEESTVLVAIQQKYTHLCGRNTLGKLPSQLLGVLKGPVWSAGPDS